MLGLNCHIHKNKGEVTKVTSPNGEDSLLYKEALQVLGDKNKALDVWSTAYSNGYAEYLDLSPKEIGLAQVDKNGEPLYRNVMAYLGDKVYVSGSYTSPQMRELNNFMMASKLTTEDVRNAIENSFYKQNNLIINEYNLRDSGLYTEEEIRRIVNDPDIRREVEESLSSLIEYLEDNIPNRDYYLAEPVGEDLIYADGYNIYGKRNIVNPSDIDIALRDQVGGIKDRTEFDRAMGGLSYQQVVERYISDPEYASRIYNRYSALTRIPKMEIGGDGLAPAGSDTAGILIMYSHYSGTDSEAMLDAIESINMIEPESWTSETVKPVLKSIEINAVKMGIDVIGLSDMYDTRTQDQFDEFLSTLYVFTTELGTQDANVDFNGFAEVYDRFFDRNKENVYVTSLSNNLAVLDLVYMRSSLSKAELFDRYNLLAVPGYNHIYQQISKENIDDVYTELYNTHLGLEGGAGVLPTKAFYPTAFSGGKFDQRKYDNPDNQEDIMRDMKRYVMSTILPNETEEMALYHIIYEHPSIEQEYVDIQREYDIFKSAKKIPDFGNIGFIRQWLLSEKLYSKKKYEEGLKYFYFDAIGNLSLISDDPNVIKAADLALDNERVREDVKNLAFVSNEPTLQNLFYINDNGNNFQDTAFRGWLYTRHPSMLPDFRGIIQGRSRGIIEANSYDDFIKVEGSIYGKINERTVGCVYQRIGLAENGMLYADADIADLEMNTGMPQEETVAGAGASSMVRIDKTIPVSDPLNSRLEC